MTARLLALLLAAAACAPRAGAAPGEANGSAGGDSLRGVVQVVGSEPATEVALLMDGGRRGITLRGPRPALDHVSGLEVVVWGEPQPPRHYRVDRFAVRASSGVPAVDGWLGEDAAGIFLETADGERLPLPHLPAALAGRTGARVWLAGPLDRPPDSFGIIEEARP